MTDTQLRRRCRRHIHFRNKFTSDVHKNFEPGKATPETKTPAAFLLPCPESSRTLDQELQTAVDRGAQLSGLYILFFFNKSQFVSRLRDFCDFVFKRQLRQVCKMSFIRDKLICFNVFMSIFQWVKGTRLNLFNS